MSAAQGPACEKCGKRVSARRVTRCPFCRAVLCHGCTNCFGQLAGNCYTKPADPIAAVAVKEIARGQSADLDEAKDLLRAVLRCEDVHTSRSWMRRAKRFVGDE